MSLRYAVILILVVLIVVAWARTGECIDGISGFWVPSPSFLERAGLRDMFLYVAPDGAPSVRGKTMVFKKELVGYFMMVDESGNILHNSPVAIKYWRSPFRMVTGLMTLFGRPFALSTTSDAFDAAVFTYDPRAQTLAIVGPDEDGEDEVVAFLYKDALASDVAGVELG